MSSFKRLLAGLMRRIHHRGVVSPAIGIPYVLGQGLNSPFIEPALEVHWHPPYTVMEAEAPVEKKVRFHCLLEKLGFRKKSA